VTSSSHQTYKKDVKRYFGILESLIINEDGLREEKEG